MLYADQQTQRETFHVLVPFADVGLMAVPVAGSVPPRNGVETQTNEMQPAPEYWREFRQAWDQSWLYGHQESAKHLLQQSSNPGDTGGDNY